MSEGSVTRSGAPGYLVALIGAVAFFVGCFLPYSVAFLPGERSFSFFRLMVARRSTLADLAGYVDLFVPLAVVAVIAGIGWLGPRWWTVPAFLGASSVWAIAWLGSLLGVVGLIDPLRYGFWVMIIGVVVVAAGAVLVALSARHVGPLQEGSEREPAGLLP